jgi:hypothetical protein
MRFAAAAASLWMKEIGAADLHLGRGAPGGRKALRRQKEAGLRKLGWPVLQCALFLAILVVGYLVGTAAASI